MRRCIYRILTLATALIVVALIAIAVLMAQTACADTVTWNGGETTWTEPDSDSFGVSTTYYSGDTVQFEGAGQGIITITATGVNPLAITMTSGAYTFSGGTGTVSSGFSIGVNSSSAGLIINNSGKWNLQGSGLTIGHYSTANAIGNTMTINGGTVTNAGAVNIGYLSVAGALQASQNALILTNGANLFCSGINVGNATVNGSQNMFNNTLAVVGSFVQANGPLGIAFSVSNSGQSLNANNNQVVVDGGSLQGLTGINIYGGYSGRTTSFKYNSLIVTNGGSVSSSGSLNLDTSTDSNHLSNSVVVANGGYLSTAGATIGAGATSYAYLNVIGSSGKTSTWNVGAGALTLAGVNTSIKIDGAGVEGGAVVTNVAAVTIKVSGSGGIVLTNGGKIFSTGNILVGSGSSYLTNTLVGGGADSFWDAGGGSSMLSIGDQAASYNQLVVGAGVVMTNISTISLGTQRSSSTLNGNSLVVTNGGKVFASGTMYVGNLINVSGGNSGTANSNTVVITSGGIVNIGGGVTVGLDCYGGPSTLIGNSVTINSGGQLFSVGNSIIGSASEGGTSTMVSNNVTITGTNGSTGAASLWDLGGGNLYVGYAITAGGTVTNSFLTVSAGGVLTNAGIITVGYRTAGYSGYNSIVIAGGNIYAGSATITNWGQVTLNAGGGSLSTTGSITFATGTTLAVNIGEKQEAPSSRLAAGGTLDISGATLNLSAPLLTPPSVPAYIIASYGVPLTGQFAVTNGLPWNWKLNYNYNALNQIALIPPPPSGFVITLR